MSWNNWFHTNLRWPLDCTRRTWRISRTSKISFSRPPEFWPCRNGISLSGVNFLWSLQRTSNNAPKLIYRRPCHAALDETHHSGSVLHQRKESNHHRFPAGKKKLNSLSFWADFSTFKKKTCHFGSYQKFTTNPPKTNTTNLQNTFKTNLSKIYHFRYQQKIAVFFVPQPFL